jgi:hypothetical protein
VEARAYDGIQFSDVVSVTFIVEAKEDDSPGFELVVAIMALTIASVVIADRRR